MKTKEIERYEAGDIAKITKALSKMFKQTNNCSENQAVELEYCATVDIANICLVEAKTEKAKRVLSIFIDIDNIPKQLSLDYIVRFIDVNKKYTSKYSTDYVLQILDVLKHTCDHIKVSLKEDFPSVIETNDFKFTLAPRIERD